MKAPALGDNYRPDRGFVSGCAIAIIGTAPADSTGNTAEDNIPDIELIQSCLGYHRRVDNTDIGKHNDHVLALQFPLAKAMTVDLHAAVELVFAVIQAHLINKSIRLARKRGNQSNSWLRIGCGAAPALDRCSVCAAYGRQDREEEQDWQMKPMGTANGGTSATLHSFFPVIIDTMIIDACNIHASRKVTNKLLKKIPNNSAVRI